MTVTPTRRALGFAGYLLAVACFVAAIWWVAFTSALGQLEQRGRADLTLAADRLTGQLQRFRELAVFLADHPVLSDLVLDRGGSVAEAHKLLQEVGDKTGTLALLLADDIGRVLASSQVDGLRDLADAPYFRRAMDGALGAGHGIGGPERQRIYSFAAPVFEPGGPVRGAVVTRVRLDSLEWGWPAEASAVFFADEDGVVFVSNRSELILTSRGEASGVPFPVFSARKIRGHDVWRLEGGRYLPRRALHLAQPLPVIGMTAEILLDLGPVIRLATLQAAVAAALCLAFGTLLFLATERRRVLDDLLKAEAAANAALEGRVVQRTAELSQANADLLREIGERKDAEAALTRAQADLVQAGKLSALGQMSAGISHELNQPLMAIQSFAENGALLLERGKTEAAAQNLGRIGEMARRMARIIKNLRAFARQETTALSDVDLVAVVDAALEIAEPRVARDGVTLDWARPQGQLMVRGGEVRLQQVVVNLLANAVDAMADSPDKRIEIWLVSGIPVVLGIRDTGPGIVDPDRIFDPFYSTKEVGKSEGMGLGLSISYGLVQSFGGAIRGRNDPRGGAVFTVELAPAALEAAA